MIEMDKKSVIQKIIRDLEEEMALLAGSSETTAAVTEKRRSDLEAQILVLKFLPSRTYSPEDVIVPSSLLKLRVSNRESYCLIVPNGGGWVTDWEGIPLQIITPYSPLGEHLVGKKSGDRFSVDFRTGPKEYEILESH